MSSKERDFKIYNITGMYDYPEGICEFNGLIKIYQINTQGIFAGNISEDPFYPDIATSNIRGSIDMTVANELKLRFLKFPADKNKDDEICNKLVNNYIETYCYNLRKYSEGFEGKYHGYGQLGICVLQPATNKIDAIKVHIKSEIAFPIILQLRELKEC
jgi:hypothetical protein